MVERAPFQLLIVGVRLPPETFLARLINGLARSGVAVTVAGSGTRGPSDLDPSVHQMMLPSWEAPRLVRLLRLWSMGLRACIGAPRDLRLFADYVRQQTSAAERLCTLHSLLPFAGRRWDAVYFPWNSAAIAYLPLFDLGMPVIVSCRGAQVNIAPHDPERKELAAGLRETFRRATAVHCVSEDILCVAQRLGLDPERARVIRPAVDPEQFCPGAKTPEERGALRIVSTGSLHWRKGYEYALLAVRKIVSRGIPVQYEIIGDGLERQRVLYTVHDLELESLVRLSGRLPPAEVVRRLQQADIFLLSSLSEGISNAALEGMACGLPIVTTDCGGMREAVTDGVEGFVTPVRDAEAMANALAKLAVSPQLRWRMGEAARHRIVCEFTLERQIAQWRELLQSLSVSS